MPLDGIEPRGPAKLRTAKAGALLTLIYICCVLVHIWILWEPSLFPHISSDEVQYSAVGESLRNGRGYTAHGGFHSSIPPLYPVLIALAHSVGQRRLLLSDGPVDTVQTHGITTSGRQVYALQQTCAVSGTIY
jgi:hypothetical protein